MEDPRLYSQFNDLPRIEIQRFLKNYQHFGICDKSSKVIDIGCGDGSNTRMLGEYLGENFSVILGLDKSKNMVNFAKKGTIKGEKVEFRVGDITKEIDLIDLFGEFDCIFSFFCFNWIQDQKTAWKNIYNLLKPSGQVYVIFLTNTSFYHVYETQAKNPKWSKYMDEIGQHVTPYLHCQNPDKILENILKLCGFSVKICKKVNERYVYATEEILNGSIEAVNPFMKHMPSNIHAEYLADFREILHKLPNVITDSQSTEIFYEVLHVVAMK